MNVEERLVNKTPNNVESKSPKKNIEVITHKMSCDLESRNAVEPEVLKRCNDANVVSNAEMI